MNKQKDFLRDAVLSYGIYIAFVLICIVFAILSPDFFSWFELLLLRVDVD